MIELGNPLFIVYGCTRDLLLIKLEHGAASMVQWRSPVTYYPPSELILNQTLDSMVPVEAPVKVVVKFRVFSVVAIFFACSCGWNTT